MTTIVPGVLAHSLAELRDQLNKLKWAKKVHIDIMDGAFVPNKTIQALTLKKALPKMDMQIHLMARNPHKHINSFARLGAKELIIHHEATKHAPDVLEDIRLTGMKAGIAFNPETRVDKHALVHSDIALVMTVHPGFSGQPFLKKPLRKIAAIRKHNPLITVGIDGGVNHNTCSLAKQAGADFAIATSAVTTTGDPQKAYRALQRTIR